MGSSYDSVVDHYWDSNVCLSASYLGKGIISGFFTVAWQ